MDWEDQLFDGDVDQYDGLNQAMNRLQRLVAERRASEADGSLSALFRLVTGLDGKIEEMVAEVRQQAAAFGSRHARAAVQWTERLVMSRGASGNAVPMLSNAALLELRVAIFEECAVGVTGGDELNARCDELREAVADFCARKEQVNYVIARDAGPAGLVWSAGDAMPARLLAWGCDEELWNLVTNKRALVRLANTEGGEARCRKRLEALRKVVDDEESARRAARRAERRAERTGSYESSSRRRRKLADSQAASAAARPPDGRDVLPFSLMQTDEYRQTIPAELVAWGCDAELWQKVKKKNALRRLAKIGDEEHGRKRIAALKERFALEEAAGEAAPAAEVLDAAGARLLEHERRGVPSANGPK